MKELFESSYLSIMSEENDKLRNENKHLQDKIDKAIEYNKNIIKESWYGGNEKKYAKTNLEILGDKENE